MRAHLTLSLFAICLLCVSALHGQSARRLRGTVVDQTGGFITYGSVSILSDDLVLTTKVGQSGEFEFDNIPPSARYLDVLSPGFWPYSLRVDDQTPERLTITLWAASFSGCLPVVTSPRAIVSSSLSYEGRSGNVQFSGRVTDDAGVPLVSAAVSLLRADVEATSVPQEDQPFGFGLRKRSFKQTAVDKVISNDKGEFQFGDFLEPGWYTVNAATDHLFGGMKFWIARQNNIRISLALLEQRPCGDYEY